MTAKVPKMAPKGVPHGRQNPPEIGKSELRDLSPWLFRFRVPFWMLFGQGLSPQNVALAISKPHFGSSTKGRFLGSVLSSFWVLLGSLLALFGFSGAFQNKVPKMTPKKTAPKPKMSQNGLPKSDPEIHHTGVPERLFWNMCSPWAPGS